MLWMSAAVADDSTKTNRLHCSGATTNGDRVKRSLLIRRQLVIVDVRLAMNVPVSAFHTRGAHNASK